MKRQSLGPAGFSFLEVLVAVAVLAVVLVTVLATCLGMQESVLRCREIDALSALAMAKLVEVERIGVRNWQVTDGDFGPGQPQWKWHVDFIKGLPGGMTLATVTVSASGTVSSSTHIDKVLVK